MKATLLLRERHVLTEQSFAELVVWHVPSPLPGSPHPFKYRLAYVIDGVCVLRYDNETGKGDHCHVDGWEATYSFISPEKLLADFWHDIDRWRAK
jgi:hypothetical protein